VALDRQSIEKKDFPVGRRGYDPEAVDAHLKTLADEIDDLKRSARRKSETLASSASEQVRAIVEAAETSAADIQRQAEEEAREIRDEATSEAESTREQATAQAREYVGKVSESTSSMLQRLDAMESELGALIESLRTGSNRLNADLQLLEGNLTEVGDAVSPRPRFEPEPAAIELVEEEVDIELVAPDRGEPLMYDPEEGTLVQPPGAESELEPTADVTEPLARPDVAPPPQFDEPLVPPHPDPSAYPDESPVHADTVSAAGGMSSLASHPVAVAEGDEGARLIALNMALNGTPREDTDKYLSENFQLSDRHGLLDEVYASVEG
jgi:DivIVA domain-containing protein